jgi:hypothetical protein
MSLQQHARCFRAPLHPQPSARHAPAEEILALPDELGALPGDILDALSP